jgi:hypothetical protein
MLFAATHTQPLPERLVIITFCICVIIFAIQTIREREKRRKRQGKNRR